MSRARGQTTRRSIDRRYPHKVTVLAENVGGKNLDAVIVFHAQIDQPRHSRSAFKDDRWYQTYYFADPQHARSFKALFGAETKEAAH
jgi:YHS domain-containing protein